eukprot:gene29066-38120_t
MAGSNESDDVMDSLSTVLYNMTCRESNLDPMLQDAYYENIAKAMSTLCCERHCTDILIRTDILSDLIVIALLKTSSEAFYNMFCHDGTRLQLLKGDLWWAMMRLCRQDSNEVRTISARALYNFSCDPDTEGLARCSQLTSLKNAIVLLLKCSQHRVGTTLADLDPLCSMLLLSYIHHKREFSAEIHDNIAAVFLQFRRPAHSENTAYATYTSFCSCRVALTALFSRSVETIVLEQPDLGFLSDDLCVDTLTIGHVLVIIHFLSEVPALCSHLVDAHVFRVLDTYITRASATNEFKTAQEFCAIFLRNISLHSANLTKYACEKASFLHSLLSNTIDDASDAAVNLDISLFLCNVSDYLLDIDTEDDENIKASPHTYPGKASQQQQQHRNSKSGGKVSFLTPKMSMFTYLRKNDVTVPETAVNLTFKACNEIVASRAVTSELSRGGKSSVVVPLEAFAADDSYWQPIKKTGYKRNQNIILKALTATVLRYETLEKCDSPPITAFIKIEKEFEMVRSGHSDQLAITEGDEKEEEDNDDDDDDLYTDAEQSDISPGIDKQPLSPASVGVSGGNQEFKDASEEHDDSVTVADTQEEN